MVIPNECRDFMILSGQLKSHFGDLFSWNIHAKSVAVFCFGKIVAQDEKIIIWELGELLNWSKFIGFEGIFWTSHVLLRVSFCWVCKTKKEGGRVQNYSKMLPKRTQELDWGFWWTFWVVKSGFCQWVSGLNDHFWPFWRSFWWPFLVKNRCKNGSGVWTGKNCPTGLKNNKLEAWRTWKSVKIHWCLGYILNIALFAPSFCLLGV